MPIKPGRTKAAPYAKAIAAFLVALTGALAVGAADNTITLGEGLAALATAVAAGAAVFGVRNRPST